MKKVLLAITLLGFMTACSQSDDKTQMTLDQQVDQLVTEAKFDEAMELLDETSSEEALKLREDVHLRHGIYLIYNADPSQMRENANNALREFIAVLELNPDNEKARAEIEQILGIYRSFPDRQPAEDVLEQLRDFGFQI
ncbi:outer membrane protein assembly factor BamD [Gracilimonas amylolytica]|uniref:hypothetical protein n=1 Tax=Gracilimonas amylolytica TaxID=1749045 RepID=UPI001E500E7F|nr:hypothetical protein [Gracilimonas amylolytica]